MFVLLFTMGKPKKFSTCCDEKLCKGEYSTPILLWMKLFGVFGCNNGLGMFIPLYCEIDEDFRALDSPFVDGFTSSCKIPAVLKSYWIPSPYSTWIRVLWFFLWTGFYLISWFFSWAFDDPSLFSWTWCNFRTKIVVGKRCLGLYNYSYWLSLSYESP